MQTPSTLVTQHQRLATCRHNPHEIMSSPVRFFTLPESDIHFGPLQAPRIFHFTTSLGTCSSCFKHTIQPGVFLFVSCPQGGSFFPRFRCKFITAMPIFPLGIENAAAFCRAAFTSFISGLIVAASTVTTAPPSRSGTSFAKQSAASCAA